MIELFLSVGSDGLPLPVGAYREFRLFIVSVNGANYAQICNINIYDAGDVDVLRQAGVVANQSSYYADGGTFTAYQTIDGRTDTKWTSSSSQQNNSWLSFVIPEPIIPVKFAISNIAIPTNEGVRMPKAFRLEGKGNDGQWVTLITPPEQTNWAAGEVRTFTIS